MQPAQMYDSAATMYSPDGRIYQVEYAREAVKRGTTALGLVYADGVLLLVDRRVTSPLIEPGSVEKLFKLDHHIGAASSGLVADARVLVNRARLEAQVNRITYGEPVETGMLVRNLSDLQQAYTQNGGVRPFGTALLVGGVEKGGHFKLFETDPSGAIVAYRATAIGVGRAAVMEFLEGEYREGLAFQDAMALGARGLARVAEGSTPQAKPDAALITKDGYRRLTPQEVEAALPRGA